MIIGDIISYSFPRSNTSYYIKVDRLRYLQSQSALAMDVHPVGEGGVGTDVAEVMINPGHLSGSLPAQAAEETKAASEQEKIVDCVYPAGSPHPANLTLKLKHCPSESC